MAESPAKRLEQRWAAALEARAREGRLRELPGPRTGPDGRQAVDFSSNDYLGLARDAGLQQRLAERLSQRLAGRAANGQHGPQHGGSGGSRLLTGNHPDMLALEEKAAAYHGVESGLLFGSGYHANAGLIAALAREGDVLLFDRLVHACMHEGMKLSPATARPFAHNSVQALAEALAWAGQHTKPGGQVYVLAESVYSMDGDVAPLADMARLCLAHEAVLLVDEAHGAGLLGPRGAGAVAALPAELQQAVVARVVTYGKAFGAAGGMVLGPPLLRAHLINHCKPFLYTTAPHAAQVQAIDLAYEAVAAADAQRARLGALRRQLLEGLRGTVLEPPALLDLDAAVVPLMLPAAQETDRNQAVLDLSEQLLEAGLDLRAIRSPTVAPGSERLRCCLHAFNTPEEVDRLLEALQRFTAAYTP